MRLGIQENVIDRKSILNIVALHHTAPAMIVSLS